MNKGILFVAKDVAPSQALDLLSMKIAGVGNGYVVLASLAFGKGFPVGFSAVLGFLPIERAWIDKVIESGYVDIFRQQHSDLKDAYTYWDMKTFARDRNVGWRIDYFFVSQGLIDLVKKTEILDNVMGSDHCPIGLEIM
jgi:hypothetical protein